MIKVTLEYHNHFSFYTLVPVRSDLIEKVIKHLSEYNINSNGKAFFQNFYEIPDFITDKKAVKAFLKNGAKNVTFLADPWEIGHVYGYDTHTLFE